MSAIEICTFRLVESTDDEAFLAADRRVQTEFVPFEPGFVRRTMARGGDGEWLVLTLWGSVEDAKAAEAAARSHEAVAPFSALVDPSSVTLTRYTNLDG